MTDLFFSCVVHPSPLGGDLILMEVDEHEFAEVLFKHSKLLSKSCIQREGHQKVQL